MSMLMQMNILHILLYAYKAKFINMHVIMLDV
jgi:hypothetical protein